MGFGRRPADELSNTDGRVGRRSKPITVADFQPISQVATFDLAMAVGPTVPAKSLQALVVWLKSNPAQGSYGTPAAGSQPHFLATQFARAAGLNLRHVAYKGSALAITT
jgi:tripartite-type tricarboxylate transporter receptor subunit TctC